MSDQEKIEELLVKLKEKDTEDYTHSLRVQEVAKKFVELFDITSEEKETIVTAAILHDIGILDIEDYILKKAGRLNFDEYEEIKHHVEKADSIIKGLACYEKIKDIIRHHHENVNGFGYPDSLEKDEIPLGSKILHVIEAYDTMTKGRKNRKAVFTKDRAAKELLEYADRIYDKDVVEKFVTLIPELD
ncbi:HD-GYP domain-containing protein [Candidatus Margulisiibacteriota bacterium]